MERLDFPRCVSYHLRRATLTEYWIGLSFSLREVKFRYCTVLYSTSFTFLRMNMYCKVQYSNQIDRRELEENVFSPPQSVGVEVHEASFMINGLRFWFICAGYMQPAIGIEIKDVEIDSLRPRSGPDGIGGGETYLHVKWTGVEALPTQFAMKLQDE